jgi:hypothetical protein
METHHLQRVRQQLLGAAMGHGDFQTRLVRRLANIKHGGLPFPKVTERRIMDSRITDIGDPLERIAQTLESLPRFPDRK